VLLAAVTALATQLGGHSSTPPAAAATTPVSQETSAPAPTAPETTASDTQATTDPTATSASTENPSVPPSTAGTEYLSSIQPLHTSGVSVTTGSEQIGTTTYPYSARISCCSTYPPRNITYNVAGFEFLDATIGVPNDATNAAGNTMAVTFFKDGSTQLGTPVNIALGHPQQVHLDLQGAQQLVIQFSATTDATHQLANMDIVFGNATFDSTTPAATKSS
jgi:hypothetical protein